MARRSPAHLLASASRLALEVFVATRVGRLLVLVLPQVHAHGCVPPSSLTIPPQSARPDRREHQVMVPSDQVKLF